MFTSDGGSSKARSFISKISIPIIFMQELNPANSSISEIMVKTDNMPEI